MQKGLKREERTEDRERTKEREGTRLHGREMETEIKREREGESSKRARKGQTHTFPPFSVI